MANPDNVRLLAEEKAVAQAEAAIQAQETALGQRVEVAADPAFDQRVQSLLGRMAVLESAGLQTADFPKARAALQGAAAASGSLATSERQAALAARGKARQAREAVLRHLTQNVAQLESWRTKQRKDLEAIEAFLQNAEAAAQRAKR
jgi:hypothetical protein